VCLDEDCSAEDCPAEVGSLQVCPAEVCSPEDGVAEVCLTEVCPAEVCLAEVCPSQVCLAEVGVAEHCHTEVGVAEHCPSEVHVARVCLDEVCSAEGRPPKVYPDVRMLLSPGIPCTHIVLQPMQETQISHVVSLDCASCKTLPAVGTQEGLAVETHYSAS